MRNRAIGAELPPPPLTTPQSMCSAKPNEVSVSGSGPSASAICCRFAVALACL